MRYLCALEAVAGPYLRSRWRRIRTVRLVRASLSRTHNTGGERFHNRLARRQILESFFGVLCDRQRTQDAAGLGTRLRKPRMLPRIPTGPTNDHISNFYLRYRYSRAYISSITRCRGVSGLFWGKSCTSTFSPLVERVRVFIGRKTEIAKTADALPRVSALPCPRHRY